MAKIGPKYLTVREFTLCTAFNPYLTGVKDERTAKRLMLHSLLAEKALALAAQQAGRDKERWFRERQDQFRREATIEKLWQDSIFAKVKISEQELWRLYLRSGQKRVIQYLIYGDSLSAARDRQRLQNGLSFERLAQGQGYSPDQIPQDTIKANSPLRELRHCAFGLQPGQVGGPVKAGPYYFLVRLTGIKVVMNRSRSDFDRERHRLVKFLRQEKRQVLFEQFVRRHCRQAPYQLDRRVFKKVVQVLDARLFNTAQPQTAKVGGALPELVPERLSGLPVVRFANGRVWTVGTLLRRLALGPYPLAFSSPGRFRNSMIAATKNNLDDQVLYDLALQFGMGDTEYVRAETHMWSDYLLAEQRFSELKEEEAAKALMDTLARIFKRYPPQINRSLFDTLQVARSDMFVFKTHFPLRSIAPVVWPHLLPDSLLAK